MKWDKIKKRVADGVYEHITTSRDWETSAVILVDLIAAERPGPGPLSSLKRAYAAKAEEVIKAWDVRAVARLRSLFPGDFPPSLREGRLIAGYDEAGDWAVWKEVA